MSNETNQGRPSWLPPFFWSRKGAGAVHIGAHLLASYAFTLSAIYLAIGTDTAGVIASGCLGVVTLLAGGLAGTGAAQVLSQGAADYKAQKRKGEP